MTEYKGEMCLVCADGWIVQSMRKENLNMGLLCLKFAHAC